MTGSIKSFGGLWQAQRTFANTDEKRAAWDAEDAAMRQSATADEAYELRVMNKQLSLLPALMKSQINDLETQLNKIAADPDGAKARKLVDHLIDVLHAGWQNALDRNVKASGVAATKRKASKVRRVYTGMEAYFAVCKSCKVNQLTTDEQWKKAFDRYTTNVATTPNRGKWNLTTFKRHVSKTLRS